MRHYSATQVKSDSAVLQPLDSDWRVTWKQLAGETKLWLNCKTSHQSRTTEESNKLSLRQQPFLSLEHNQKEHIQLTGTCPRAFSVNWFERHNNRNMCSGKTRTKGTWLMWIIPTPVLVFHCKCFCFKCTVSLPSTLCKYSMFATDTASKEQIAY